MKILSKKQMIEILIRNYVRQSYKHYYSECLLELKKIDPNINSFCLSQYNYINIIKVYDHGEAIYMKIIL